MREKTRRDYYVRRAGIRIIPVLCDAAFNLVTFCHTVMSSGDVCTVFVGLNFLHSRVQKLRRFSPWPLKYVVQQ